MSPRGERPFPGNHLKPRTGSRTQGRGSGFHWKHIWFLIRQIPHGFQGQTAGKSKAVICQDRALIPSAALTRLQSVRQHQPGASGSGMGLPMALPSVIFRRADPGNQSAWRGAGRSWEEHPWKVVLAFRTDSSRSSPFLGLEWISERQWAGLL